MSKKAKKVKVKLNFQEVIMIQMLMDDHFYGRKTFKYCENFERPFVISLMDKFANANYKICK